MNKDLWRIFKPNTQEAKGGWIKLYNEELHNFHS
jgi:hypothetical protein